MQSQEANKTTRRSARRSVVENSLTEPTLLEMSGYGGGFNASTQYQIETEAQGFQQPRVVRERRLNGTPSWLGFD